jgi:cell division transport system permease protein
MKFIKNHLMFILPLIGILFSLEFYFAFDRTTKDYEKSLKDGYVMLVVSKKVLTLPKVRKLNSHVVSLVPIKSEAIVAKIVKDSDADAKEVMRRLPYFYSVKLDSYLDNSALQGVQKDLETHRDIRRVESFSASHASNYKLFSFIKLLLKLFIAIMGILSLFLIMKQVEVWKYTHRERMEVMEIFGASLMLRSGVLFKIAIVDTLVATLITSLIFIYMKFVWAAQSGIYFVMQYGHYLFEFSDIVKLLGYVLPVVIVAVYIVVSSTTNTPKRG